MREYKMRRGEHLQERVPDLKGLIEETFGPVSGTEEYEGNELYVVDEPTNPVFVRVVAGAVSYPNRKDTLAVDFEERPAKELLAEGLADAAADAVEAKNEFLLETTGRDAKSRRKSLKREVEDEAEVPDGA